MFDRWYANDLQTKLSRPYVHLLFGARHLLPFLLEKKKKANHGYVICRCPRPLRLHDQITALPWFCL